MGTEKRRINTQMPRRLKVRTATPMASEWDISVGSPPSALRTPADKMRTGSSNSQATPDTSPALPKKNASLPGS